MGGPVDADGPREAAGKTEMALVTRAEMTLVPRAEMALVPRAEMALVPRARTEVVLGPRIAGACVVPAWIGKEVGTPRLVGQIGHASLCACCCSHPFERSDASNRHALGRRPTSAMALCAMTRIRPLGPAAPAL